LTFTFFFSETIKKFEKLRVAHRHEFLMPIWIFLLPIWIFLLRFKSKLHKKIKKIKIFAKLNKSWPFAASP